MYPIITLGFVKLYVFPFILMTAFFSCLFVFILSKKYDTFSFPIIQKAMLYAMAGAVVGGKLLFLLTQIGKVGVSFIDLFSGFVFYGGFIGALVGLYVYSKKHQQSFLDFTDVFASLLPLGQAIGRLGCYCNGCCYGKEYHGFLAVRYVIEGKSVYVFPTWFVESAFCLTVFIAFFCITKPKPSGFYTSAYMILYSVFRFFIEFMRGDTIRGVWNGLSTSQFVSIIIMAAGIILAIASEKKKLKNKIIIERGKWNEV